MTKKAQIAELKRMVDRAIKGFPGKDHTTRMVNVQLAHAYHALCYAYNQSQEWLPKPKHPKTFED